MAGYLGNIPVPQATQTRDRFVATAGQTSFATSGYDVGFLDVYLNGVKLDSTDYTATNGSDVVLAIGASADDIIEVVAFSTFEIGSNVDNASVATQSLVVDRQSTDGTIAEFRKDGSTVGSIGVSQNDSYIGTGDTGITFSDGVDAVVPFSTSGVAYRDAAIDLGYSNQRFKDLYLSGGVYLGGTGSANYLEDYEEGTWTPSASNAYGNIGNFTSWDCRYTKVGNMVTLYGKLYWSSSQTMTSTDRVIISGIPFSGADNFTGNRDGGGGTWVRYASFGGDDLATGCVWAGTNDIWLTVTKASGGYTTEGLAFVSTYFTAD